MTPVYLIGAMFRHLRQLHDEQPYIEGMYVNKRLHLSLPDNSPTVGQRKTTDGIRLNVKKGSGPETSTPLFSPRYGGNNHTTCLKRHKLLNMSQRDLMFITEQTSTEEMKRKLGENRQNNHDK